MKIKILGFISVLLLLGCATNKVSKKIDVLFDSEYKEFKKYCPACIDSTLNDSVSLLVKQFNGEPLEVFFFNQNKKFFKYVMFSPKGYPSYIASYNSENKEIKSKGVSAIVIKKKCEIDSISDIIVKPIRLPFFHTSIELYTSNYPFDQFKFKSTMLVEDDRPKLLRDTDFVKDKVLLRLVVKNEFEGLLISDTIQFDKVRCSQGQEEEGFLIDATPLVDW